MQLEYDPQDVRFVQEEVRKNFIKSSVLVAVLVAVVMGLSYAIGYFLNDIAMGLMIGVIISLVVIPIQIMTGKMAILAMAKGRPADPENIRERRAMHLLEGLAISAGLKKTPELYIIPSGVPNAFASGLNENDAFVGVTEGLLDMMDDQELEGVLGHEMAHIVHRDIMLNQLVVALISVILLLSIVLERVCVMASFSGGSRRSNRDNGGGGAIILVLVL